MATALQQRLSQEALPDKECDLLRTSIQVSPVGGNLSFQARGGEKVRFTYQMGQWHAEVLSRIGAFSRQAVLPLVCSSGEDVASSIEVLSRYPSWQSQRQIHVLGRNVCPTLGEVVYVGELGLKGGSRGAPAGSGEERIEPLRASSEPAPVAGDAVSLVYRLKVLALDPKIGQQPEKLISLGEVLLKLAASKQESGDATQDLSLYTDAAILYQHVLGICAKGQDTSDPQAASALEKPAYQGLAQLQASMLARATGLATEAITQGDVEALQRSISEDKGELAALRNDVKLSAANLVSDLEDVLSDPGSSAEAIKRAEEAYIQGSQALFGEIAQRVISLLSRLYQESESALGPAPCKYTVMGLGSMAFEQITPYSDLAFAILMEDAEDEATAAAWREYLRKLTHLVHFRVINLGETVLHYSQYKSSLAHLGKRGLNFDLGGKTPLGRKDKSHLYELIQPVSGMMEYLQNEGNKIEHMDKLLPYVLESACYIHGDSGLHERYVAEKRAFLLESRDESGNPTYQKRALKKLLEGIVEMDYRNSAQAKSGRRQGGDLNDFDPKFGEEGAGRLYNVKQEIYGLPDRLLYQLAMYYGILPTSGWDAVDQLKQHGIIGVGENAQQASHHLHYAVSFATMLRLETYLHHGQQFERATMLGDIKQEKEVRRAVRAAFALPASSLQAGGSLFKYYYTALPLHRKLKEFFRVWDKEFFEQLGLGPELIGFWKSLELPDKLSSSWRDREEIPFFQAEPFYDDSDWNKGRIYHRLLQYKKSLEHEQRALEMIEATHKGNHPHVAASLDNVGSAYGALGKYQDALAYHKRALEMREAIYAGHHSDVAASLDKVGSTYEELGQHQEALTYHKRALEMREAIYAGHHSDVAASLDNVGSIYGQLSQYQEALAYRKRALKMREAIYAGHHSDVAASLHNVGSTYGELGKHYEALAYHRRALEMREAIYAGHHPDVAVSLNSVGSTYWALGQHQEALLYQKYALEMHEGIYAGMHPDTAVYLNDLGLTYGQLGQHQEALACHKRALKMLEAMYKGSHSAVAASLGNVGSAYRNLGKHYEALAYQKSALTILETIYEENHPSVAAALNNVGSSYGEIGQYQEALAYQKSALAVFEVIYAGNHPSVATSLNNVGYVYGQLGQHQEALAHQKRALEILEAMYSGNHPSVAALLNNMGYTYGELGQHQEALIYKKRAFEMRDAIYAGNHPDVAVSLNNLSNTCYALGDARKAVSYLERALGIMRKFYEEQHSHTQHIKRDMEALKNELAHQTAQFTQACLSGNEDLLANMSLSLLEKDLCDNAGNSLISWMAQHKMASTLEKVLALGWNPHLPNTNQVYPLHYGAMMDVALTKLLLQAGAHPFVQTPRESTPAMVAKKKENMQALALLLPAQAMLSFEDLSTFEISYQTYKERFTASAAGDEELWSFWNWPFN